MFAWKPLQSFSSIWLSALASEFGIPVLLAAPAALAPFAGLVCAIPNDLGLMCAKTLHAYSHLRPALAACPPTAELLRHGHMSCAVDVYAFGVMMWEVYTSEVAFRELHYGQFFETVVLRDQRPPVPPGMPEDYKCVSPDWPQHTHWPTVGEKRIRREQWVCGVGDIKPHQEADSCNAA